MSTLYALIKALLPHIPTQQERDEAYLAESVDAPDLERRLRQIDHRDQTRADGVVLGHGLF